MRSPASNKLAPPIGLALAGGAPGGAIYEIGAMRALDEAIDGFDLTQCGTYVGVSAGAFLTACLANGLRTDQQVRAIVKREPDEHPFRPEIFFKPAVKEVGRRVLQAPSLLGGALRDYVTRKEKRLIDALTVLGRSLPVGIFDNDPVRDYVERIFSIKGRTDDFTQLDRKLTVVTTDLESGESMRFGYLGSPHVPISVAVQASTALPGLYPPVEINGRHYVDGILLKTMHASVALEAGAELVFCINPLVPVDTRSAVQQNLLRSAPVSRRGLPAVLSQAVRTLIHSRMNLGLKAYDSDYPDADVILIEPPRDDYEDFFSNIFSFSSRRAVVEHAFDATRRNLMARRKEIEPVLARHGLQLNVDFLHDAQTDVWKSVGLPEFSSHGPDTELHDMIPATKPEGAESDLRRDLESMLERIDRLVVERRTEIAHLS
ncbi:MAG: patatin-like phospholipase family protein [Acidobacteriota bacterium]